MGFGTFDLYKLRFEHIQCWLYIRVYKMEEILSYLINMNILLDHLDFLCIDYWVHKGTGNKDLLVHRLVSVQLIIETHSLEKQLKKKSLMNTKFNRKGDKNFIRSSDKVHLTNGSP